MNPEFVHRLVLAPALAPCIVIAIMVHELAHAWVAHALGDPLPRNHGRLTLDPRVHLDAFGSGMYAFTFLFVGLPIGWGRPVPLGRFVLRHERRDVAVIACAGPLASLLVAALLIALDAHVLQLQSGYVADLYHFVVFTNVLLAAVHLLPVPPLDGARIVGLFLRDSAYETWKGLEPYGFVFFLVIFMVLQEDAFNVVNDFGNVLVNLIVRVVA
jgi:Zn-dependent protease